MAYNDYSILYMGGPGLDPGPAPRPPAGGPDPTTALIHNPDGTVAYPSGYQYDLAANWNDYKVAYQRWQMANDAFKRGYYYRADGQYQDAELTHNNRYMANGRGTSLYGVTTSKPTPGSGATYGGAGGGTGGGSGSAGGGTGGSAGGGGGSGAGGTAPSPYTPEVQKGLEGLDKYDRDAASAIINLFNTYGLSSMAPLVIDMIKRGMGEAAIVASLRETKEYKTRFPGMEALRQQGYNAISEAQYLQLEDSYHQALQSAGLPKGFYDDAKDFVGFISNGVDPSELKQRATAAVDLANQVDPAQRELLSSMYGVSATDLAAYFLDPKRAMPILQKQLGTVQVANAAQKAGIQADFANRNRFERLVDNGIGAEQAAQGYSQIAFEMDPLKNLASIWGSGADNKWSLDDAENATFFGNAQANKKKQRLAGQERAAFSGASGFDSRVSGRGNTAGSF